MEDEERDEAVETFMTKKKTKVQAALKSLLAWS
jgi:hypothetical protein